jgi:hypothetical protein
MISLGKVMGAIGVIVVFVLIIVLIAFRGYSVPSDMVAIRVGAGPFEASKIKGDCIPASTRGYLTNDDYEYFPTSEREWDATGQEGSDGGKFKSVTVDNVEMAIPVTVRFTLVTECDTLKDFYIRYARRYNVDFENDGSYNKEWITLLRKLVADPADATLDRIIQDYPWRAVWNDPATKVEIEKRFNDALSGDTSLMIQTAKGTFFDGISVLVGKPEPTNPALAEAVAKEQTNVAQAQAAEAQAKADKARAEAETAVAIAEAAKQQAVIAGYGGPENYLLHECIVSGCNPYQPTYGTAVTPTK